MATLERIRKRSGLLIIVIGLAMLAFILTGLMKSGRSLFRADANLVGKVEGQSIGYQEFSQKMQQREEEIKKQNPQQAQYITQKQLADAVWDEIVRNKVMSDQYDELGISVSPDELADRIKSNPSIQNAPAFKDKSGKFNEALLQQYLNAISDQRGQNEKMAEQYDNWISFEHSVKENALQTKYTTAIQKGLYMPTALAKQAYLADNNTNSTQFIMLPYSSIPDSTVKVDDSDFRKYYDDHKENFKAEASASIEYVSFPIEASPEDKLNIKQELTDMLHQEVVKGDTLESFTNTKKDSMYAVTRSDLPVANVFYSRKDLPAGLDSNFFDQKEGYIQGPYEASGYYRLTKLVEHKTMPDSVKARHILISFKTQENQQAPRDFKEAKTLADSLLKVVKSGNVNFDSLAVKYSDDPGSAKKGGDLGWFQRDKMIRPFAKFCFQNSTGDIGMVLSRYGFHIIEILDQKGKVPTVRLISISREITPSDGTIDNIYTKASTFASAAQQSGNFSAEATKMGYQPRPVTDLKPFDEAIVGVGNNREIVRWANKEETELNSVKLFNNNNNAYVVAVLINRQQKGYQDLANIKEQIRPEVLKAKKAEMLKEKMSKAMEGKSDINAIAQSLGVEVRTDNLTFRNATLAGVGREPKVVGAATVIEPGKISQPIEGNIGVYVLTVTGHGEAKAIADYSGEKQKGVEGIRSRASSQAYQSLKDNVDIEDHRTNFY